jgi:hypothetical protein
LLWQQHEPVTAYDILGRLTGRNRRQIASRS